MRFIKFKLPRYIGFESHLSKQCISAQLGNAHITARWFSTFWNICQIVGRWRSWKRKKSVNLSTQWLEKISLVIFWFAELLASLDTCNSDSISDPFAGKESRCRVGSSQKRNFPCPWCNLRKQLWIWPLHKLRKFLCIYWICCIYWHFILSWARRFWRAFWTIRISLRTVLSTES